LSLASCWRGPVRLRRASTKRAKPGTEAAPQAVPGLFLGSRGSGAAGIFPGLTVIRFPDRNDYPPFNFIRPDGNPAGFNVDLARLLCDEIKSAAHPDAPVRERCWMPITSNRGDAIICVAGGDTATARSA